MSDYANGTRSRKHGSWWGLVALLALSLPVCWVLLRYFVAIPLAASHVEAIGGRVMHDTKFLTTYEIVDLSNTQATDKDLRYVKIIGAPCLDLRNTQITDAGLRHLYGIDWLTLDIDGTKVTNAGVAELKRHCRHCSVFRDGELVEE